MKTTRKLLVALLALIMMVSMFGLTSLVGTFANETTTEEATEAVCECGCEGCKKVKCGDVCGEECKCGGECECGEECSEKCGEDCACSKCNCEKCDCGCENCICNGPEMELRRDLYIDWEKYDLQQAQPPNYKHNHDYDNGEECDCDPDDPSSMFFFGTWYTEEDPTPASPPVKTTYMKGVFEGEGKESDGVFLETLGPPKYTGWRHWDMSFRNDMVRITGMDLRDYDAMIFKVKYPLRPDGTRNVNSLRRISPTFSSGESYLDKKGNPTIDFYCGQLDVKGLEDYAKVQRYTPEWEDNVLDYTYEIEYRFEFRNMVKLWTTRKITEEAFAQLNNSGWAIQIGDWTGDTDDPDAIAYGGFSGPYMYLGNVYLERMAKIEPTNTVGVDEGLYKKIKELFFKLPSDRTKTWDEYTKAEQDIIIAFIQACDEADFITLNKLAEDLEDFYMIYQDFLAIYIYDPVIGDDEDDDTPYDTGVQSPIALTVLAAGAGLIIYKLKKQK